jgi:hypothetical protein
MDMNASSMRVPASPGACPRTTAAATATEQGLTLVHFLRST